MSGKVLIAGVLTLVIGLAFALMAVFGVGFFKRSTADFRGETEQIERVQADPNYRIAAYEHFYDLCASVQTKEATAVALHEELKSGPSDSRREQINATLTALTSSRAAAINQYNADARKADTKANFLASDLPYQLSLLAKETSCAA